MIAIRQGAILDKAQKKIISNIEPFTTGLDMEVTRGHSTPREQLETIAKLATENGVFFPEFDSAVKDMETIIDIPTVGRVYTWARTVSKLLNIGVVVNPPIRMICLFPYERPSGEQMMGKGINPSPHIKPVPTDEEVDEGNYDPCPIDFSAKVNGISNLLLARQIMVRAMAAGAGIKFVKPEPKNGCIHNDTEKI
jgi:hypothetical protein